MRGADHANKKDAAYFVLVFFVISVTAGTVSAASSSKLYVLHNDGKLWEYTGTPMTGWQLIDDNLKTEIIITA